MKNKAENVKPSESGDDQQNVLVDHMVQHEEMVKEKPVRGEKKHTQLKKASKSPEFVNTDSQDLDNDDEK